MKKLNRKGFTLVELLAVIIILAIVIGISIPAITSVINNSKNSALGIATESAYDYLRDQYDIYNIDPSSASSVMAELITAGANGQTYVSGTDDTKLEMLGFKKENVSSVKVTVEHDAVTQTASICVTVESVPQNSEYFTTTHWTLDAATKVATAKASSGVKNKAGNGCQ